MPPATVAEMAVAVLEHRNGLVAGKTLATEAYHIKHGLPAALSVLPVTQVTAHEVSEAIADLLRAGRSRRTVKRSLSVLRVILDRAVVLGVIDTNPATTLKVPPGTGKPPTPINPLTAEDLRAMVEIQQARSPLATMTLVMGLTGLRWGEIRELRTRDVQIGPIPAIRVNRSRPDGQPVRLPKNGRPRLIPLSEEAASVVLPRAVGHPNALLWPSRNGTPVYGPNYRRSVQWPLTGRGRRVHDLRHTAATLWLGAGLDVKTVQTWLGHASATLTLDLYGHWRGLDADIAAVTRFNEAIRPPTLRKGA